MMSMTCFIIPILLFHNSKNNDNKIKTEFIMPYTNITNNNNIITNYNTLCNRLQIYGIW